MQVVDLFSCPGCLGTLAETNSELTCTSCGRTFPWLADGVPDLTFPQMLHEQTAGHRAYFDTLAPRYDTTLAELLQHGEHTFRRTLVEKLRAEHAQRVLEVAVGTGLNLPYLSEQHPQAHIVGLDLSPSMIVHCLSNSTPYTERLSLCVGNGEYLPFADQSFDAVLHFGFINEFNDRPKAFHEIARVLKENGTAVVSDDSIIPALRHTPWAQELMRRNISFGMDPPVQDVPAAFANYQVEWFQGIFYILTLQKAAGEQLVVAGHATQAVHDGVR